jgi:hypothetical protein
MNKDHDLLITSVGPPPTGGVEASVETLFRMLNGMHLTQVSMSMRPYGQGIIPLPLPAPFLIRCFLTDYQSLKRVQLRFFIDLNEDAVNTLHVEGGSTTLEMELFDCTFTNGGHQALVEILRNNQGPTKIMCG